jgi:hypothetical protein
MKGRRVHYVAHGMGGLLFDCYRREVRAHLDTPLAEGRPGMPARHTDLRRVTCPECWRQIAAMVKALKGGAA